MSESFTPMETAVITSLLAGDHVALVQLRAQWSVATVRAREHHPAGVFTEFWVDDTAEALPVPHRFSIDDVAGRLSSGVEVGFYLHIVRGRLKTLECLSFEHDWPEGDPLVEHWHVVPDPQQSGWREATPQRDLAFALRGLESDGEETD